MIEKFYIIGSKKEKPESKKTIFADGSADQTFRKGIDLELSHWYPNTTPKKYKADTSTEICLKYLEDPSATDWELVVNNHTDVDGVLSVFCLVNSEFALKNKDLIIKAAEMGDFWAWHEKPAQILFQGLTMFMNKREIKELDDTEIYRYCFEEVIRIIETDSYPEKLKPRLKALEQSIERVKNGTIKRSVINSRYTHYHIPLKIAVQNMINTMKVPHFNALFREDMLLWPQVRNYFDDQKIQMVSVEVKDGFHYDLYYPGYMWAETPNRWRAPGFTNNDSVNVYYYGYQPLSEAVENLNRIESGPGNWTLVKHLTPFKTIKGRNFPVILSFMNEKSRKPGVSKLTPEAVNQIIAPVFINTKP